MAFQRFASPGDRIYMEYGETAMADEQYLNMLLGGITAWNAWRHTCLNLRIDLTGASLRESLLGGADLRNVDLHGADLTEAQLSSARLNQSDLGDADDSVQ